MIYLFHTRSLTTDRAEKTKDGHDDEHNLFHGRFFFLFGEYTNETITGSENFFEIEFTRRVP